MGPIATLTEIQHRAKRIGSPIETLRGIEMLATDGLREIQFSPSKEQLYRKALESIRTFADPALVQSSNWPKIVYEVASAALEDPPREINAMLLTQDFTPTGDRPGVFTHTFENHRGPTASDLVDALAERFGPHHDVRIIRTEEWWREGDDRQRREQTILRIGRTGMEAAIYFSPHEPEIVESIGILPSVAWDVARKIFAAAQSLGIEIQE